MVVILTKDEWEELFKKDSCDNNETNGISIEDLIELYGEL